MQTESNSMARKYPLDHNYTPNRYLKISNNHQERFFQNYFYEILTKLRIISKALNENNYNNWSVKFGDPGHKIVFYKQFFLEKLVYARASSASACNGGAHEYHIVVGEVALPYRIALFLRPPAHSGYSDYASWSYLRRLPYL